MTKDQLQTITSQVRSLIAESPTASPGRQAEICVELSSLYATLAEELKDVLVFKADKWLEVRTDLKSDKMADRIWDSLGEGKSEIELRSQLKYIEKQISSIKLLLRVREGEMRGSY